jgi:hypothetical protein
LGVGKVPADFPKVLTAGRQIIDRLDPGWKLPTDCGRAFVHGSLLNGIGTLPLQRVPGSIFVDDDPFVEYVTVTYGLAVM